MPSAYAVQIVRRMPGALWQLFATNLTRLVTNPCKHNSSKKPIRIATMIL
jgi:hypothetical protein